MTTAALSLKIRREAKSKIEAVSMPSANWKIVCILGFCVSLALLVFYVWQVNDLTRGYYTIDGFKKQIISLEDSNKNLQVSFAENSFLGQAMASAQALNFQKAGTPKYIQIPDSSVATTIK